MSLSISNSNFKTTILDIVTIKKNLNCIVKFRLFKSVAQYINFCLIFNNVFINDFTITSDIKLNL